MALDSPKKPFSKRYRYRGQAKDITVWESAPENLRHFVLDKAVELNFGPHALRDAICSVLHVRPDPGNWSEYPNVWGEAEGLVYDCDWFRFYDFIEKIWQEMQRPHLVEKAEQFEQALNDFFIDEGIGWQMIGGEIATRGTETFESNVHGAVGALEQARRVTPATKSTKHLLTYRDGLRRI